MRLVRVENGVRLLTVKTGIDLTAQMAALLAIARVARSRPRICPATCSRKTRRAADWSGSRSTTATAVPPAPAADCSPRRSSSAYPYLPVEEEGRLSDPRLRDNFVERVFAYCAAARPVRRPLDGRRSGALSHRAQAAPAGARARGVSAARASRGGRAECRGGTLERRYAEGFMRALARLATRAAAHERAAAHGRLLQGSARRGVEARAARGDRRLPPRLVPLVVPLTLVRHHVRVLDVTVSGRTDYLEPHPKELMLRNHV